LSLGDNAGAFAFYVGPSERISSECIQTHGSKPNGLSEIQPFCCNSLMQKHIGIQLALHAIKQSERSALHPSDIAEPLIAPRPFFGVPEPFFAIDPLFPTLCLSPQMLEMWQDALRTAASNRACDLGPAE
jgi:hypothetical protein